MILLASKLSWSSQRVTFGKVYNALCEIEIILSKMGCIRTQIKKQQKLRPADYRIIWIKCLKLDTIEINSKATSYHPVFIQIDKDIDRTYPDAPEFNKPEMKQTFRNVLRGFALEFPKIGYTQGLNFVAGMFLLTGFSQKQALKCLIALCTNPNLMLLGLFEDDFPLCRLYCELFWEILKLTNPDAYKILKESTLPDEMWIFQWFITLFTYSLPHSYLKEIFNFIIVKGLFAVVRIAIGILQSLQKYLRVAEAKEQTLIECLQYMKNEDFCLKYLPIEGILKRAQKIKNHLIFSCLQECKISNFYKYYFLCVSNFREKKHKRFIQDLNIERKKYELENDVSNNSRYSREIDSIKIIDNIEQSRMKRFSRVLTRSSRDKMNPFFSNLSFRRCNSLDIVTIKQ